jgi:hypothetical protein
MNHPHAAYTTNQVQNVANLNPARIHYAMTLTAWCWLCWPRLLYSSCSPCPPRGSALTTGSAVGHECVRRHPDPDTLTRARSSAQRASAVFFIHLRTERTDGNTLPSVGRRSHKPRSVATERLGARSPPTSSLRVPRRVFSVPPALSLDVRATVRSWARARGEALVSIPRGPSRR